MTALGRHAPHQRTAPIVLAAATLLLFSPAFLLAEPPPSAGPPLRGPEVSDRDVPGAPGDFGSGQDRRRLAERIPLPVFRDAVMSLAGEDVPAELRLTDEQAEALRRHQRRFERARREHMAEHGAELRRLREQAGPPDPEADGATTPARREALDRFREIERAAPQPESLYTKIWEELTPRQREAVEARLEAFRQQRAKEREERYVRQRVPGPSRSPRSPSADRPDAMDAGAPMIEGRPQAQQRPDRSRRPAPDTPAAQERRERIDRLIRVFDQLPPEAQERLLRRLEAHAAELRADQDRPASPPRRRPPPSMDEVDVPPPDGPDPR